MCTNFSETVCVEWMCSAADVIGSFDMTVVIVAVRLIILFVLFSVQRNVAVVVVFGFDKEVMVALSVVAIMK